MLARKELAALVLAFALGIVPGAPVRAELVTRVVDGQIDFATSDNLLGLDTDGLLRLTVTFDPADLFIPREDLVFVRFFEGSTSTLRLQVGDRIFTERDDNSFGPSPHGNVGLPFVQLRAGTLDPIDLSFFVLIDDPRGQSALAVFTDLGVVENGVPRFVVTGTFHFVPEPPFLLGLALAALAGLRARRDRMRRRQPASPAARQPVYSSVS